MRTGEEKRQIRERETSERRAALDLSSVTDGEDPGKGYVDQGPGEARDDGMSKPPTPDHRTMAQRTGDANCDYEDEFGARWWLPKFVEVEDLEGNTEEFDREEGVTLLARLVTLEPNGNGGLIVKEFDHDEDEEKFSETIFPLANLKRIKVDRYKSGKPPKGDDDGEE